MPECFHTYIVYKMALYTFSSPFLYHYHYYNNHHYYYFRLTAFLQVSVGQPVPPRVLLLHLLTCSVTELLWFSGTTAVHVTQSSVWQQ